MNLKIRNLTGTIAGLFTAMAATTAVVHAQTIEPPFDADYSLTDLGPVPGVPPYYGGLTFKHDDPNTILIGGLANNAEGKLYAITVTRGPDQRITGFSGTATEFADAAYNDGGVAYGPSNVLFLARWPINQIGQTKPGSAITDKIVSLADLDIPTGPGGLTFVPQGFPGAGRLKMAAYTDHRWYDMTLAPDGLGTFNILNATNITSLTGRPEGIFYVPPGSPQFTPYGQLMICEYGFGSIAVYNIDANGDPVANTRTPFLTGLTGAEGATVDPLTGDFLFSTFGGGSRVVVVRGFAPPPAPPQFLGPCPYFCSNQSPFANLSCEGFQLVTFEEGTWPVAGVTASTGAPYGPDGLADSVDCDDGVIDGLGQNGRSFFYVDSGVTFTFDPDVLGGFPTHAGVVWTDGSNTAYLEVYDRFGQSVGATEPVPVGDGSFGGTTGDDRFFGVVYPDGISAIRIWNGGGTEVDHLQFGRCTGAVTNVCPPTNTVALACSLIPQISTNTVGSAHQVTATITTNNVGVAGLNVAFSVTGAHSIASTNVLTAGNGQASFSYLGANIGADTIRAIASLNSNATTCTVTKVWVAAPQPCVVTCPANITTNTAPGVCGANVSFNIASSGNCPTIVTTPASGSFFPAGTTPVTVTTNGLTACTFNVTVNDNQPPGVSCPANISTNVPAGVASAVVNFTTPAGADNCGVAGVVCAPSSGSSFPLGATLVTCTATDTAGLTGQCAFNVTVTQSAASANLGITKTADASLVALGSNVVFTITVTNAGPNTAESVVVGDALPGLLAFEGVTTTQGSCSNLNGVVGCELGSLAAGQAAIIQIAAGTLAVGTNCNFAVVDSATADPLSANNRSGACVAVFRPATGSDVSLTKAAVPDAVIFGNTAVFELRVQNLGPGLADGVVVSDWLPEGVEFVGVTTTRGSCAQDGGLVSCALGELDTQTIVTIQITVRGVEVGESCNVAEVACSTEDPLLANNVDGACLRVREDRERDNDLAVTKLVAPRTITFTGNKTKLKDRVSVQIQNRGPKSLTIKNATVLANLVKLTAESLGVCPPPGIKLVVGTPQVALPATLTPKQKVTVWFEVTFDRGCVNDPAGSSAADPGHEDYRWIAEVDVSAINGKADTNPQDDVCPRYGRPPFPRAPNAPTTIREKGCGSNAPDGSARGGDVLTDVVVP